MVARLNRLTAGSRRPRSGGRGRVRRGLLCGDPQAAAAQSRPRRDPTVPPPERGPAGHRGADRAVLEVCA